MVMTKKHTVILQPSGRRGQVDEGTSVRAAARELGVEIESICAENATCGKCMVLVEEGRFEKYNIDSQRENLSPLGAEERAYLLRRPKLLKEKGWEIGQVRLSCQCKVMGDVLINVPEESRGNKQIVRKSARERAIDPDLPVSNLATMARRVDENVFMDRMTAILSAGFALTMSAVGHAAMLLGAAVGGGMLLRGSSASMLRGSFAIRAVAVALPIAALPATATAPPLMYAASALAGVGFATGQLAANERLFRLVRGPTVIRQHGRLLFRTSAAMTTGYVTSGVVLAVGGPLGYPAFAALYGASAALRVFAYRAAGALPVAAGSAEVPALPSGSGAQPAVRPG